MTSRRFQEDTLHHLVIVIPDCANRTIADNAIHRAKSLSKYFKVSMVSNVFPQSLPSGIDTYTVESRSFNLFRRYAHAPREYQFGLAARKCVSSLIQKMRIDFLFCHGHSSAYVVGKYFKKAENIPYAVFLHGVIFDRPPGTYHWLHTAYYKYVTTQVHKNANLVFAQSPLNAESAIESGAPSKNVFIAPNGIDAKDIGASAAGFRNEKLSFAARHMEKAPLRLLYVGRFNRDKGFDVLLKSCQIALEKFKVAFHLKVIGGLDGAEDLRNQVKVMGLGDVVEFIGFVERIKLAQFYRNADCLCMPSRSEPMGNVVLEALSLGVPVIATNVGGNPFMVKNEINGLLVPADDSFSFANAITYMYENPDRRKAMGDQSCESVAHFTWEAVAKTIYEAFRSKFPL